jgi:hypothetical protein
MDWNGKLLIGFLRGLLAMPASWLAAGVWFGAVSLLEGRGLERRRIPSSTCTLVYCQGARETCVMRRTRQVRAQQVDQFRLRELGKCVTKKSGSWLVVSNSHHIDSNSLCRM